MKTKTLPLPYLDHIAATRGMTLAAKGAFIDLLCFQARDGSMPEDDGGICRAIGSSVDEWSGIKDEILPLLRTTMGGGFTYEPLWEAMEKQARISKARSKVAKQRWDAEKAKPDAKQNAVNLDIEDTEKSTFHVELKPTIDTESLESFLLIAGGLDVPKDFAEAIWHKFEGDGWPDGSRSLLLDSLWRENNQQPSGTPEDIEQARIDAEIKRLRQRITDLENDPGNRQRAQGYELSKDEHMAKYEPAWLAVVERCRDELREKFPAEYQAFKATMEGMEVPKGITADELELVMIADHDEEIPNFKKWDETFNRENKWVDPDELTKGAKIEIRNVKQMIASLELEVR